MGRSCGRPPVRVTKRHASQASGDVWPIDRPPHPKALLSASRLTAAPGAWLRRAPRGSPPTSDGRRYAPMVGRSPVAARQLASRARRRVKGAAAAQPGPDLSAQREVVDAFFRAAHGGDFEGLVAVLDPEVVLRADYGAGRPGSKVFRGPNAVTSQARPVPGAVITPVLVNGGPGVVITLEGRALAVMGFTIVDRRIVEIDAIADPDRVGDIAAGLRLQTRAS